jgi:uncharacterized LabA/DUF88 family protein
MATRIAIYVDGFNLYYGMKARSGRRFLWLDLQGLAGSLLRQGQTLTAVNYFTARVRNQPDSEARQTAYIDALTAHCPLLKVIDGRFQEKQRRCPNCGQVRRTFEEKETDVNIASALITDAVEDVFDTALLVTGDSDLCPAVRAVRQLRADKRIVAAFPPGRHSTELKQITHGHTFIGADKIRQAQLPYSVTTSIGVAITRPKYWS